MTNQYFAKLWTEAYTLLIEEKILCLLEGETFTVRELMDATGMAKTTIQHKLDSISESMNVKLQGVWSKNIDKKVQLYNISEVSSYMKKKRQALDGTGGRTKNRKQKFMCLCVIDNARTWISVSATSKEMAVLYTCEDLESIQTILGVCDKQEYSKIRMDTGKQLSAPSNQIQGNNVAVRFSGKTRRVE